MKQLPLIPKIIINLVLFGLYFVVGSVIAALIYGGGSMIFGYNIPQANDPMYESIGWAALVATFIVTLVFRKYFYMNLSSEEMEEAHVHKKKKHDFSME